MKPAEDRRFRAASSDEIEEAAATWLARRYGGLSAAESAEFNAWMAADRRHAEAVADLEQAWKVISSPAAAGQGDIAAERQRVRERFRTRRRRQVTMGGAAVVVAALAIWVATVTRPSFPESNVSPRIALRPDVQQLPDGSTIELNAGSDVVPVFSPEKRLVHLVRGEALFDVARDPSRPFVVLAGAVEVRAIGTAFSVRYDPSEVDILVTKGTVMVEHAIAGGRDLAAEKLPARRGVAVNAGQRAVIVLAQPADMPPVTRVTPREIATVLAWRDHRVEFTRTSLAKAVELFNRHNHLQLSVADPDTGNFEISGIFWADNPDSFVRLLESAFDMTAERTGETILLRKR